MAIELLRFRRELATLAGVILPDTTRHQLESDVLSGQVNLNGSTKSRCRNRCRYYLTHSPVLTHYSAPTHRSIGRS